MPLALSLLTLAGSGAGWGVPAYFAFAVATAWMPRSVRHEAVARLGRRAVRRGVVAALAATCVALAAIAALPSGRLVLAIAELVVVLPGAALPPVPVAAAVAAGWLALVGWTPAQAAATSRSFGVDASATGSTCRHFVGGRIVGGGLRATVGMRAEPRAGPTAWRTSPPSRARRAPSRPAATARSTTRCALVWGRCRSGSAPGRWPWSRSSGATGASCAGPEPRVPSEP